MVKVQDNIVGGNNVLRERIKGILIGILIGVIATGSFAFARSGSQLIEAVYSDVKICVNDKNITPKDADGNEVEPFIVNGTTYLPVRAVASALDKKVEWDGNSKTVKISDASEVVVDFDWYNVDADNENYVTVSNSKYNSNVVFEPRGTVTDFKIIEIEYVETVDSNLMFRLVDVPYQKKTFEDPDYVVSGIDLGEIFSRYGIMYTNDNGETKTFMITDGSFRGEGIMRINLTEITIVSK